MNYHLTTDQLFIGAFALILILIFGMAAFLEELIKKPAPFHNYFAVERDPELQHDLWDEDPLLNRPARLTPFNLRDTGANTGGISVDASQRSRELN